ncbi:hypothetical protein HanPSC8_Chr03g0115371 [Helianthus annuus]|nr:hypothetical protein HanPSC8_Chr03g0115371 [Helianthus annuus]
MLCWINHYKEKLRRLRCVSETNELSHSIVKQYASKRARLPKRVSTKRVGKFGQFLASNL